MSIGTSRRGQARPFLKWAGGKYRILPRIQTLLPAGERLVEPFVGSAAVFLNTDFDHYLLGDTNRDLIGLYRTLQADGANFVDYCTSLFDAANNSPAAYYQLRDEFNHSRDVHHRSALFVYLNRHGYNGLCRYNSKGEFNVPFGRYKSPYFPAAEMLAFHHKAQRAEFRHDDFAHIIAEARRGDVIYCDPPYVPLSRSANFTTYSAGGFDLEQQNMLAKLACKSAARGIPVLVSNHNTRFTREAYRSAKLSKFKVQRFISCDALNRNTAGELLALFT